MTIKSLRVGCFGKLKNLEINLEDGCNLIYGENESGKSTLQAFIKAQFYGMNSQKKDIKENDRLHYIPWGEQRAQGELYFADCYENNYVIKRSFGKKKRDDESEIINVVTGETAPHIPTERPGEEVFGLGEEAFERTAWIKQSGSGVVKGKDDELIRRLTNLQESGEEKVSYQKSIEVLNEARKSITNQRKTGTFDKLNEDYSKLLQELRESSLLYHESIENEMQLKLMAEEKVQLNNQLKNLESVREDRSEYDKWTGLRGRVDEAEIYANSLCEKMRDFENLLSRYKAYENLDDEAVQQLIGAIKEKERLNEKVLEYNSLLVEWRNSEEELNNFSKSLGKIANFKKVNKTMEIEINKLEKTLKDLQYKLEQSGKRDNLTLRRDILIDKNKSLAILFLLGTGIVLGGLSGGILINKLLYILIAVGIMLLLLGVNSKNNNSKKINELNNQIVEIDNPEIQNDIDVTRSRLQEMYRELGVMNYEEFIEELGSFREKQGKLEALKIKTQEKRLALHKTDIDDLKYRLNNTNDYINETFNLYNCTSIETLNSKLREYSEIKNDKKSLQRELAKVNENLSSLKKELENLEEELVDKIDSFRSNSPLTEDEINTLTRELHERLIALEKNIKDTEHSIKLRLLNHRQPTEIQEELSFVKERIEHYEKNILTIDMTKIVLQEAFQEMQRNFGPRLNRMAADVLEEITCGKYENLKISEEYEIKVVDHITDSIMHMDYFSNGTWDQLYFSLRMGLINLLFDKDYTIPIILDDAFLQYDDIRLEKALDYLYRCSKERQVIVFTCQRREMEILKKYKNVNYIELM